METNFSSMMSDGDRRSVGRHMVVLQLGVLGTECSEQLCLVLNISQGGMQLRIIDEAPRRGRVSVMLRGDRCFAGEIAWRKQDLVGVRFHSPLSLEDLLAAARGRSQGSRAPRLNVALSAVVRSGSVTCPVTVRNISPGGAALAARSFQPPERLIRLALPGIEPVSGQVRWQAGDLLGMSFNRTLRLSELQTVLQLHARGHANAQDNP